MPTYRVFFTVHTLSDAEEKKTLNPDDHPEIRYKKRKKSEDVEGENANVVVDKILGEWVIPSRINPAIEKQHVRFYAICDTKDGEKLKKLSDCFSAIEQELPL